MKKTLPVLFLITSCSTQSDKTKSSQLGTTKVVKSLKPKVISDSTNTLTGQIENLELNHIVWGCACANWVTPGDFDKYQNSNLAEHCIFIEPASKDLVPPLYFDPNRHRIKVQGQFYVKPDYPKGSVQSEEHLDKANVFRYTKIEVSKRDIKYSAKDDTTLNLSYNAIACTCAQWSDTKLTADTGKREYFYLELADDKLINADELYKGNNLPIQIQVTGQIVSYVGYPTGYNPIKGHPKPEIVFRYTKIKVLKNGQIKKAY